MQKNNSLVFLALLVAMMLAGCYHQPAAVRHAVVDSLTTQQFDSITFARTHHYTNNYNFVVSADSLVLTLQMPEEAVSELPTDSISVKKN